MSTWYPIPTPISHPYLRRAVPTCNGACAENRVSPAYGSDSSSSTTSKMAATVAGGEVYLTSLLLRSVAAVAAVQTQPQGQQQHNSISGTSQQTTTRSIRSKYHENRTRTVWALSHSILTTGMNQDTSNMSSIEHLITDTST